MNPNPRHGNTFFASGVIDRMYRDKVEAFGQRCGYCPNRAMTRDHHYPVSRGGRHEISNLYPSCQRCNDLKADLLPEEWEQGRALLKIGYRIGGPGWQRWEAGAWRPFLGRPKLPSLHQEVVSRDTGPRSCPVCGCRYRPQTGPWPEINRTVKYPLQSISLQLAICPECGTAVTKREQFRTLSPQVLASKSA